MTTTKIEPHGMYAFYTPDEVAETIDGIYSYNDGALYAKLWDITVEIERAPGHRTNEEKEEPTHGDNNVAGYWDRFTEDEQRHMNAVAAQLHAENTP